VIEGDDTAAGGVRLPRLAVKLEPRHRNRNDGGIWKPGSQEKILKRSQEGRKGGIALVIDRQLAEIAGSVSMTFAKRGVATRVLTRTDKRGARPSQRVWTRLHTPGCG
jgi:hypothetical protein